MVLHAYVIVVALSHRTATAIQLNTQSTPPTTYAAAAAAVLLVSR